MMNLTAFINCYKTWQENTFQKCVCIFFFKAVFDLLNEIVFHKQLNTFTLTAAILRGNGSTETFKNFKLNLTIHKNLLFHLSINEVCV